MEKESKEPPLLATTHISLIVRLLLDSQGQVKRGELVDLRGQVIGRFVQLAEIPTLLSSWLKHQADNDNRH